jgi:uncharacterized surface protein with fasciclin (FAS1) repeats
MKLNRFADSIHILLVLTSVGAVSALLTFPTIGRAGSHPSIFASSNQTNLMAGSTSQQPTATPSQNQPSSQAPASPATGTNPSEQTIIEVARANGSFKTLLAALESAGLTQVLQGSGPFTVFAPTDEAFAALPPEGLQELLKPENREILIKILTYHVVPGEVTSGQLRSGPVQTVEGSPVNVQVSNGQVKVNDATVIQPDVQASNGVIHVIDQVIVPPGLF